MKIQYWDVTGIEVGGCGGWDNVAEEWNGRLDAMECGGGAGEEQCWVSFEFAGGHAVLHTNPCNGRMILRQTGPTSYTLEW